jgi:hypothetical protein
MPSNKILTVLTIFGLRNPYKRDKLAKHLLYCAYISIFIIIFGFRIKFYQTNYFEYKISNLLNLFDTISFFINFCGVFVIFLESFFYRQELDQIMEEFSKIDEILMSDYHIKINDRKTDKFVQIVSITWVIFVIINGSLLTIGRNLFIGLTLPFTHLLIFFLVLKFWFICHHLNNRFGKITKFFTTTTDDRILEIDYQSIQTLFIRSSKIIVLRNKYFQLKFAFVFGN